MDYDELLKKIRIILPPPSSTYRHHPNLMQLWFALHVLCGLAYLCNKTCLNDTGLTIRFNRGHDPHLSAAQ